MATHRRVALLLVVLLSILSLATCGGGGNSTQPPPPPPSGKILSVSISTSSSRLSINATFPFRTTVQTRGSIDSSVNWYVNNVKGGNLEVGSIGTDGNYTAPSVVPAVPIIVKAVAKADGTKSATVQVTILPTIAISPSQANVVHGQTLQFLIMIAGTSDTRIQYSATLGTVSANGLYTAPESGSADQVNVRWVADDSVSANAGIRLLAPPPTISEISPGSGAVGDQLTVHGEGFMNVRSFYFTGMSGILLAAQGRQTSATEVTVTVPVGARTGALYVELLSGARSNSVQFTRNPNLRVRANHNELSGSESIQMQWRALGPGAVPKVQWQVDAGSIDSNGIFTAPAVSKETYVHATGCFVGTSVCDGVLFRVTPVRIVPTHPMVPAGESVTLSLKQGESLATPDWFLPSGLGTLSGTGDYTASTALQDAGSIPVEAKLGGLEAHDKINVTGKFPGVVNRVQDLVNEHDATPSGWSPGSILVSGNHAFVLGVTDGGTQGPFFDIFDVSDPNNPKWIDSVESLFPIAKLYKWASFLYQPEFLGSRMAVYDISSGAPQPLRVLELPPFHYVYYPNLVFHNGKFLSFVGTDWVIDRKYDDFRILNVANGYLDVSTLRITIPDSVGPVAPLARYSLGFSDTRMGVMYVNAPGAANTTLPLVYDTTTNPPTFMGRVRAFDTFQFYGSNLITDAGVYDVSGSTPVELARTNLHHVEDQKGQLFAARDSRGDLNVVDFSNPANPLIISNTLDVAGTSAAWAGNNVLTTAYLGGLASISPVPGGPRMLSAGGLAGVYDFTIDGPYAYTAGYGTTNSVQVFDISSLSSTVGAYSEGVSAYAIRKSGDYLFVGYGDHLSVLDAHNPTSLPRVAQVSIPSSYLEISGNRLFVGTFDNRLVAIDVHDPLNPVISGQVALSGTPYRMRVSGNLLLVSDVSSGLLLFDISHPNLPTLVGQFNTTAADLAVDGTTAFVAAWDGGVQILDISNPASPQLLTTIQLPSSYPWHIMNQVSSIQPYRGLSIAVHDGLLYVEAVDPIDEYDYPTLLLAYDYRQVTAPRLVSMYNHGRFPIYSIGFSGNVMFTAGGEAEFVSYDISQPRNSIMYDYAYQSLLWWGLGSSSSSARATSSRPKSHFSIQKSGTVEHPQCTRWSCGIP